MFCQVLTVYLIPYEKIQNQNLYSVARVCSFVGLENTNLTWWKYWLVIDSGTLKKVPFVCKN